MEVVVPHLQTKKFWVKKRRTNLEKNNIFWAEFSSQCPTWKINQRSFPVKRPAGVHRHYLWIWIWKRKWGASESGAPNDCASKNVIPAFKRSQPYPYFPAVEYFYFPVHVLFSNGTVKRVDSMERKNTTYCTVHFHNTKQYCTAWQY